MGDVRTRLAQLNANCFQQLPHCGFAVEHAPSLLVELDIVFNFFLHVVVYAFALYDLSEDAIDLCVQQLVLSVKILVIVF